MRKRWVVVRTRYVRDPMNVEQPPREEMNFLARDEYRARSPGTTTPWTSWTVEYDKMLRFTTRVEAENRAFLEVVKNMKDDVGEVGVFFFKGKTFTKAGRRGGITRKLNRRDRWPFTKSRKRREAERGR